MLLLELKVLLVESVDSVDHGLHKLHLGVTQAMLVGDVVSDASLATRLSPRATRLEGQLLATLLQCRQAFLRPARKVDVDRGTHASAQVGGARVQVAIPGVKQELLPGLSPDRIAHSLDATSQPVKDSLDIASLLHGDDAELVLLIDPDKEGLSIVVIDAPAFRPVTLHASSNQVLVPRHEQEVVIYQLLASSLFHSKKWIVLSRKVSLQFAKSTLHQSFDLQALILGDARGQPETVNAAPHADTGGLDRCFGIDVAIDLANVHVRSVLEPLVQSVVLQNEGVKDILEVGVGVGVASVDATMLVVKLDSAGNGLKRFLFLILKC